MKLLIAVPCYQHIEPETFKSIYDLTIPEGVEASLEIVTGYTVAQARNRCVKLSLGGGYDYTFFVDSDIILPKDTLRRLLDTPFDIVTGWYVKKLPGSSEQISELYNPTTDGETPMANIMASVIPRDRVFEITGCGFGCTLVKNDVFKSVGSDCWFEYIEWKGGAVCSEDLTFCIKARNLNYRIMACGDLRCGHKGTFIY